ncbi:MAG: RNA polymerase sigma factor [Egibacteraceae bacterium]
MMITSESIDLAAYLQDARAGDEHAWAALVARFNGLVWAVARGYGLDAAEASDVAQTTWLRLVEHLERIREPERLGAWLAKTAQREAFRTLRRAGRQYPTADLDCLDHADRSATSPEHRVLDLERDRILWECVEELPTRCRTLLRVLVADPRPSYEEVSAALEMRMGSIGPTRARCLMRLRSQLARAGLTAETAASAA